MKKAQMGFAGLLTIFLMLVGVIVAAGAIYKYTDLFSIAGGDESCDFDYSGKNVELSLQSTNKYTAAAIDPTFYVYDEEPDNWGNGRTSVADGYISSKASSSGTATLTEVPATYWVRGVTSGYYDDFRTVEVPKCGDVSLSEYNDGGEAIVKVQAIDVETLSVSSQDMGITTNETSDKTYHVFSNFNVDDDEGFCLDEVKFREDATYSFATDTDGDGIFDEGINKLKITVAGKTATPFDAASSIDEFSGDNEFVMDIGGQLYGENEVLSMKFEVTCDLTLDTTGDGDEKCGNGEDFLDDVVLVDCAGNTATFHLVG